jgi:hypothetical protein
VEYHYLSDGPDWHATTSDGIGVYRFPLRAAASVSAQVVIEASRWPDVAESHDDG